MEDLHHPRHSFLHQEQKHRYIHCNNLTHMTNLETYYLFQEGHKYCQMQRLWNVNELILCEVI